jgi:hypothetical protein
MLLLLVVVVVVVRLCVSHTAMTLLCLLPA